MVKVTRAAFELWDRSCCFGNLANMAMKGAMYFSTCVPLTSEMPMSLSGLACSFLRVICELYEVLKTSGMGVSPYKCVSLMREGASVAGKVQTPVG